MKLKRLEVYGFKSFANRMVFDFSTGLTVIVGPNGCGKSNVADSIQWIFGEMSAKALRGSGMTDVIFSGSRNRRAYSFAEGTLTFCNKDRAFSVPTDEVAITRNINRSGESEYAINGERCRLTDVKILLQGTGLGTSDYTIIQQGAVEKLISSDSHSRRAVFDEAAGVSRYKFRRDRAMRKLEKVDFALERLGDKIDATERELRSLKRRASAARRYQELTEEWEGKDLLLNNLKYDQVITRGSEVSESLSELENVLGEYGTLEAQLAADVAQMEENVFNSEKKVSSVEHQKIGLENDIRQHENNIHWLSQRIDERKTLCNEKAEENEDLVRRAGEAEKEIDGLQNEITTIDAEVSTKEESLAKDETSLAGIREEFSRVVEILEGKKRSLEETYSQSSITKNELDRLEAEKNALRTSQGEMESKLDSLKKEQHDLEERIAGLNEVIAVREAEREALSGRLDGQINQKEELVERREVLHHEISEGNHALTRIDSRLHLLLDLENKYEGISAGVKGILEELKGEDTRLTGIYGMVADFIKVEMENEGVIEIALGENVQNIIVEKTDDALRAIEYLKSNNLGTATFMPEDAARNGFEIDTRLLEQDGVEGPALAMVQFKQAHAGIVKQLLGKTVIITDIQKARAIDSALLEDVTAVTRDGYIIEHNGMLSGGSGQKLGGIISRKNEIEKLQSEYGAEKGRVNALKDEVTGLGEELTMINCGIQESETGIEEVNAALAEQRKQQLKDERDLIHINELINTMVGNVVSAGVRLEEIEEQMVAEEGKYNWFARLAELLGKEIKALEDREGNLARERDGLQKEISDLRIDLATTTGNKEIIAEKIAHQRQTISSLKLELEKNEQLISRSQREIGSNEETIAGKRGEIETQGKACEELDQELIRRRNSAEKVRGEYDVLKSKYKSILTESKKHNEKLREIELESNNLEHERNRIEENVLQYHNLNMREEHKRFTAPEEAVDQEGLEREVKTLFAARSRITGADPTAIERLESVKLRADFLSVQREDLDKARETMRNLINKINRESSRKFLESFEVIRDNFKTLFRKLFGGGRADLILEPDKDVLEAGVEIVCRPPGSQLQSISLLSGGQKAMVVICLLFSVLKSNPSPLCLLDEIDGPLDEANIDRFLALVKEFMEASQFIIITHNKKTVSKGDVIYGITMQEPGVSKKLSLAFEDIRKNEELLGEQSKPAKEEASQQ